VSDAASLESALLVQAVVTTLSLPLFLMSYTARPPLTAVSEVAVALPDEAVARSLSEGEADEQLSVGASFRAISANGQFWVHALSYGLLAGISFTIPAITANVFADCMDPALDYIAEQSMWINFAFITSGVIGGVLLGAYTPESREPLVIRLAAVACAIALGVMFALTRLGEGALGDGPALLGLLLVLISVAGAASLGFFSLGLRCAAHVGAPVAHVYTVGITETLSQLFAVSLTQSSVCPVGFKACTMSAILVATVLACAARAPKTASRLAESDSAAVAHSAARQIDS